MCESLNVRENGFVFFFSKLIWVGIRFYIQSNCPSELLRYYCIIFLALSLVKEKFDAAQKLINFK